MSGAFYRPVGNDVLQGDIFNDIPHLFLKPPLKAIRGPITLKGGRPSWGVYDYPLTGEPLELPKIGGPFNFALGEQVPVTCNVTRAMVLNHECDIENEHEHRLIALIRPLAPVTNPEHRQFIKENRNSAFFYLPPNDGGLEEAYVDFRRITSLSPSFLVPGNRLSALAPVAVLALQAQIFRHFTHRMLTTPPKSIFARMADRVKRFWT
jgi:hypothetical protein